MHRLRRVLTGLHIVILLLLFCGTAPASADGPEDTRMYLPHMLSVGQVENTAWRLENALRQQGYEVNRGYFKLYTIEECEYSYRVLGSCLGNNPAAPYVVTIVPPWPDEWVDPATQDMVGPTVKGFNASYRLDPHEAIVILGTLPPPAAYFGLQTYLLSRPGEWHTDSYQYGFVQQQIPAMFTTFFSKLPGNNARLQLFADLSNSINDVVIRNASGAVWDEERYFVVTPDQAMDRTVRQALAGLGIPDSFVFTEPIPSSVVLGLDEASDDFLTFMRYAMPYDTGVEGTPSDTWRKEPPLVVMRVRDTRPDQQSELYPPVEYDSRFSTDPPEIELESDLITLAKAVCDKWGQPCDLDGPAFDQRVPPFLNMRPELLLTGPECVAAGMNCLAPTEDSAYFMSPRLPLPDDRVYAVVGALSTQTDNATYVALGLNSSLTKLGFANIDDDHLVGTANGYAVPNPELFFLQYFARDCADIKELTAGSQCYSIKNQLPDCYDINDLSCAMLSLSVRDYIFPGSTRGPKPESIPSPRVIPLQKP